MRKTLRIRTRTLARGLTVCLALAGCARTSPAPPAGPAVGSWGFDLDGMDRSVAPGDDFFRYAVGRWVDRAVIPPDQSDWSGFTALELKAEADVRDTVDRLRAAPHPAGSVEQKVVDTYDAYLDTARIEALGVAPFQADLTLLRGLQTHEAVADAMARPGLPGNGPMAWGPTVDPKDPDHYTIVVSQSGLGLPGRDFYLRDEPAYRSVRAAYRDYVAKLLTLAGEPDADSSATAIADLEGRIAALHWPPEKTRDRDRTYNPMTRAALERLAPGFPWRAALAASGLARRERFVVRETDAIAGLARLFRATPVATWRAYLTFHYLNRQADIMPTAFDQAAFAFRGTVLGGQQVQRERWRRAVSEVNGPYGAGPLGDAVGRFYVRDHFSPQAKAAVETMVRNLLDAYQRRIRTLPWMSPETRAVAIRKAQTVRIKIGYPDRWRDYSALTIVPGDAYGNRKAIDLFEYHRELARLDGPTDKDEWSQGPQTVNAYYGPEFNEIGFPAAILQPPFFDPAADPAINYGGIGGVIGHEMGHGYDDQGAKSDEHGVLRKWWQPQDEARFRVLTTRLAAQYSAYEPLPGVHVKGDFTSGENIGDLGGLSVALDAYQASLDGVVPPVLDGFTGVQRFFLGWAQLWRGKFREERLRVLLAMDPHSPVQFRVDGVVRNIDAWYAAFGVGEGARLYLPPAERVQIW